MYIKQALVVQRLDSALRGERVEWFAYLRAVLYQVDKALLVDKLLQNINRYPLDSSLPSG